MMSSLIPSVRAKKDVLAGLGRDAVVGRDDEHRVVCLGGARDHVFHEVTVARAVDDGEVVVVRVELLVGDVDCDATLALLGEVVHHVGELEAAFALFFGFFSVLLDYVLGDAPRLEEESTHERALAVVDVADNSQILVRFVTHGVITR
jgi:hypothetical protein